MTQIIPQFDPTSPTASRTFEARSPNGGWLLLINESPVGMQLQFPNGVTRLVPAFTLRVMRLDPNQSGSVSWLAAYTLPGAPPLSLVTGEALEPSEWTAGEILLNLTRLTNVGNAIATNINTLVNDGNAAGTTVVEATTLGQSSPSLNLLNDGTVVIAALSGGTLKTLLHIVPGVGAGAASGSFGDPATPANWAINGTVALATLAAGLNNGGATIRASDTLLIASALSGGNQALDLQQGYGVWSDNTASTFTGGTTRLWVDTPNNGELHIGGRSTTNMLAGIRLRTHELRLDVASGTVPSITTTSAYLGFKVNTTTKIAEFKNNGQFVITGANPCFLSTNTTVGFATGGTFDAFDLAEMFPTHAEYPHGSVVCPQDGRMGLCTHDNCHAAHLISLTPVFCAGGGTVDDQDAPSSDGPAQPVALVGRLVLPCTGTVAANDFVISAGNGTVRSLAPGEWGHTLGIALADAGGGRVGISIRPQFARAPGATKRARKKGVKTHG
ncbi:MAG: hypothetical protein IVW55_16430 [Chloroflexi bacterium]|nr:hypothetical protein [Chloroflexota bacterium]